MRKKHLIGPAAAIFFVAVTTQAADVPLGHRDFYPTPERPVGWRGDGNGAFPGATPVTQWREGTVEMVETEIELWGDAGGNQRGTYVKRKLPTFKNRESVNVVWKTEMPGFANSSPIVVGDRAFTTAEPNSLVCVDVHTGKILWQRELNVFELLGLPAEEVKRNTELLDAAYAVAAVVYEKIGNYSRLPTKHMTAEHFRRYREDFLEAQKVAEKAMAFDTRGGVAKTQAAIKAVITELDRLIKEEPKTDDERANIGKSLGKLIGEVAGVYGTNFSPGSNKMVGWMTKEYSIIPIHHWDGWEGWTFGTPISDGKHVFVSMGHRQAACFDLNGNRIWAVAVAEPFLSSDKKLQLDVRGNDHLCSPMLTREALIVQRVGGLVGLDKATGKQLWTAPATTMNNTGHKILRLNAGKEVVACCGGGIVDTRTRKILAQVESKMTSGGPGMIGLGDTFFSYGKSSQNTLYRLKWEADKVAAEPIWKCTDPVETPSTAILMEPIILAARMVLDATTGKVLWKDTHKGDAIVGSYISPILAGSYVLSFSRGDGNRWPLRDFEKRTEVFTQGVVAKLDQVGKVVKVSDQNWLGGENKPRMPALEKYLPETYRKGIWSKEVGIPDQFGYGSPFAQGNRVFLRSCSHLYCIGDPKAPYDWNPASRPKEVTEMLTKAAK